MIGVDELTRRESTLARLVLEALSTNLVDGDLAAALQLLRLNHLARLLHYRAATISDPGARETCRRLLGLLTVEAADRLLRSPALCGILRMGTDVDRLGELLEAEMVLEADGPLVYLERWSALGNIWLGAKQPDYPFPLLCRDGRFIGPKLKCGIPVDLSLPLALERPTAGLRSPRLLTRSETHEAVGVLDASVDILQENSPSGYSIFTCLTSNIVLRLDAARPTEAWSASSGSVIGRTVIVNHALAGGPPFLSEFLLHEATHCALDCVELDNPFIVDIGGIGDNTLLSPWTGNQLSVHAFLHACVVWAVLLAYWSQFGASGWEDKKAEERHNFIRRGFEGLDTRCLEPFRTSLSDAAFRVIARTCDIALS